MIALDEPHQRFQALSLLLTRLERSETQPLEDTGLDQHALDRLRRLPIPELARLASIKQLRVGIELDGDSLTHALRTLDRMGREAHMLERCVALHAPRALLTELFGPQAVALGRRLRRRMGEQAPRGRPSLPDPATRDCIHARWHVVCEDHLPPTERWLTLAEAFPELTLASLHAVLHEFDERS